MTRLQLGGKDIVHPPVPLAHTPSPESPYYTRTVAEIWFNSAGAAEAAGFSNAQGDTGAESDVEPSPDAAEEDEK